MWLIVQELRYGNGRNSISHKVKAFRLKPGRFLYCDKFFYAEYFVDGEERKIFVINYFKIPFLLI